MKRVKQNWDIIHPEFSYLLEKMYVIKLVELSTTKLSRKLHFQETVTKIGTPKMAILI